MPLIPLREADWPMPIQIGIENMEPGRAVLVRVSYVDRATRDRALWLAVEHGHAGRVFAAGEATIVWR